MTTPQKLREARAKMYREAEEILDRSTTENRDLTPEEVERFDSLTAQIESLTSRLERLEALAADDEDAASSDEDEDVESRADEDLDDDEDRSTRSRRSLPPRTPATLRPGKAKRDVEPWLNPAHPYRLTRALDACADGRALSGVERETNDEMARRKGKRAQGFYMPTNLHSPTHRNTGRREQRAFDAATYGTGSIPAILGSEFIELFRKKAVVQRAGARVLTQMEGTFALPKQTAAATAAWVAEGAAPSGSQQTVGQVVYSPKTVAGYTDITRRLLKQTSLDAEAFVRDDLAAVLALAIDLAAINGSGSATEPKGLLQDSTVPTVAMGANGLAPSWAKIVELETTVALANADEGELCYITNAAVRGKMKTTVKDTNTAAVYLWDNNGINWHNALVSNQIPSNLTKGSSNGICSAMLFGNFADLIIVTWGALDVLVDPFTGSNAGTVRVNAMQDCDVKPRRAESFAKIVDLLTA